MSLSIDPRTTALVIVDLQHGIVAMPQAPHAARIVVQNAAKLGAALKNAGGTIAAIHVGFSLDSAERLKQPTDTPMQVPPATAPDWSGFVPEIAALNAQITIKKRQWSAFFGTELDLQLRRRGIKTVVACGLATNLGVESTVRDGWSYNYEMIVAEDACSSFLGAEAHEFSMKRIMPRISRVRTVSEIVAGISA